MRIYYHADGLGSITTLTNHMGHKVQQYAYDSFGNIKFTPFPHWIKQPFTYTGREFDYETGLYYYRARYYDPQAGRFITKDPIGFEGGDYNLYVYVQNNPLRYLDSFGLWNRDVHYDATHGIVLLIPKIECYADQIARNDQLVDDDERNPVWGGATMRRLWHFPQSGRVMALLNKACSTCKAYDIGGMLHVAQDSIAHAGYNYRWGHPPGRGIDDVAKRPAEAQLTYAVTYGYLKYISIVCDKILE
jgi:RHS repeat-associated protein